jgi:hypothetical protein
VEGLLVGAYVQRSGVSKTRPTCGDLAKDVKTTDPSTARWLTPRKASEILRSLGFTTHKTKNGAEVEIEQQRLTVLCNRYAV